MHTLPRSVPSAPSRSLLPRAPARLATLVRRLLVLALLAGTLAAQAREPDRRELSPFRGMRLVEEAIQVQVHDDVWVGLESIAGVEARTLLDGSRRLHGDKAWKRVSEDLPALLDALGHRVGDAVDLRVRDLASGKVTELRGVALTRENRQRLLKANREAAERPAAAVLSAEDARADLDALRVLLDEQFAYRELRPVDLDALLRREREALGTASVARDDLARAVDRILRAFGDGHSRLEDPPRPAEPAYLPFLVQEAAGGHVAFLEDRSGFVDERRPFVVALDGVPLERWLALARARGTQGSAAMQAREAERGLRELGALRAELGLPHAPEVEVVLRGQGGARATKRLAVAQRKPVYGTWPRGAARELDGRIGYVRIESMRDDPEFLDELDAALAKLRATRGLVLDVRGNGGGSRDALRRLAPYFLPEGGAPVVGNVAAVLLRGGKPAAPDALSDRGLYAAEWSGWNERQRAAIAAFARGFRPSWTPPPQKFSGWNYLVLDRADHPRAFAYAGRVAVLVDRGCFSATDVFAAALAALPQVTLVGEATSGGSGRAGTHRLPRSGLELQLSTMASYRPDGTLFEGNGVVPDVAVETAPEDLIGRGDSALRRACELLSKP